MPICTDIEEMPRRELNIFYVLDTSGSMGGEPIGILNSAMTETVRILSDQAAENADALLKISVLEFNGSSRWVSPNGPEDASDFMWQDLSAGGTTELGGALKELNDKLSKDKFLKSATGAFLPIIIFMTDGGPTDDYLKELDKILQNKWFDRATKIGFAVGPNHDKESIAKVVGNPEAVLATDDFETFARLIKFVSTTASILQSTSKTTATDVSGADIVKMAIEAEDDTSTIDTDFDMTIDIPTSGNDFDEGDWGDMDDWD